MNDRPLLEMVDVSRRYGHGDATTDALHPTTLGISEGEMVAITGPSGSGKSTLLNLMGLLDSPTTGDYLIAGTPTTKLGEKARTALRSQVFGFVFQAFHLLPGRSAVENTAMGMLYGRVRHKQRQTMAIEALKRVGLDHRLNVSPGTLSGGERQRVAIARALAAHPHVLLCDEPTGNLDSDNARRIMDLLRELNDSGLTVIVVTHDPTVADRCETQVQIVDGQVVAADPQAAR